MAAAAPADAALPGANGLIAFQVDGTDTTPARIYTVGPHGHGMNQVTTGAANAEAPDWSPDGEWIVFTKNGCKIALIHPDGSDMHRIDPAPNGCESDATFTPDGEHLILERNDEAAADDAIWIMDLDGGNRRRIGDGGNGEAHTPEISPDGQTVSFLSFANDGLSAIFEIDISGGDSSADVDLEDRAQTVVREAEERDRLPIGRDLGCVRLAIAAHHRSTSVAAVQIMIQYRVVSSRLVVALQDEVFAIVKAASDSQPFGAGSIR